MTSSIHVINYQEPLLFLAEKTGGRAIVDSNDVTSLLEEMRDDLFTYYSLGYTLSASGSDTVHRIEVELLAHPEYDLVYRRTLVEKSLETQVQDRVVSGLMLALDDNPMALEITAGDPTGVLRQPQANGGRERVRGEVARGTYASGPLNMRPRIRTKPLIECPKPIQIKPVFGHGLCDSSD